MKRHSAKKLLYATVVLGWLLVSSLVSGSAQAQSSKAKNRQPNSTPCMDCIRIRVGPPRVEQGPGPGIPDNLFTEIQLPKGHFRGFSASAITYAIDGATPWDMSGKPVPVIQKAPRGQYGESGEWLNHVEQSGHSLLGWLHDETGDRPGMGLQSMSLAVSENEGLSWRRLGQIITGTDPVIQGKITGVGNCDAVDGKDGYYYAYCWWNSHPGGVIVARAPVTKPGPGNWKKYFNGSWSEPGLRGNASKLKIGGLTVARWLATGETIVLGGVPGGFGLYFSRDHVNSTALPVPILLVDSGSWSKPDPREKLAYPSLLDANTGTNQLGDHWLLTYMYVKPNEVVNKRYLVFRSVDVSVSKSPISPQVGVVLACWYNPKLHDRWSTTAPVPPANGAAYKLEAKSGYLMTAVDPKQPTVELEDCLSKPGHPLVHILMQKTRQGHVCEDHGYQRSRTAGFVYSTPQPGTQPLYTCYSESEKSHFASNDSDCEKLGKQEALLGYDLKE